MTTTTRLTNEIIESTVTADKDRWLSDDDGNRGWGRLLVRINSHGDRRFYFRYSIDGKRTVLALGPYTRKPAAGKLTLSEARKITVRYSSMHRDPATRDVRCHVVASEIKVRRAASVKVSNEGVPATSLPNSRFSLLALCNAYADWLDKRGAQSARLARNYIKNHIASTEWAELPAREVSPKEITSLVRRVVDAGKTTTAQKVRQVLHAAYNMAVNASLDPMAPSGMEDFKVEINPVSATKSLSRLSKPGERALDRIELGHFWFAIASPDHDLSLPIRFVRLSLLLGGQRALQLLRCTVSDIDLENGTLTLYDGKGRRPKPRPHCLPLTAEAKVEVAWLLQHSNDLGNSHLFAGRLPEQALTEGPVSAAVRLTSKKLVASGALKAPVKYADLRRTAETQMASLNISKDVRAQIQSHDLGGIQVKHYDRWEYLPAKLEALTKWSAHLGTCAKEAINARRRSA